MIEKRVLPHRWEITLRVAFSTFLVTLYVQLLNPYGSGQTRLRHFFLDPGECCLAGFLF